MEPLSQSFYDRPTLQVAQELLGKILVRAINGRVIQGIITEVEAYVGPEDKASHASRGLMPRTKLMFGPPGYWYIYLVYGMYHCLNVVTEREEYPAAVLIRSVLCDPAANSDGPGKLCRHFQIDKKLNGSPAFTGQLYIADGIKIAATKINAAKRVGVDYAGQYKNRLWRFYIRDLPRLIPGALS